jgi:hypothetical protein
VWFLSAFDSLATGETALKERERERALFGESAELFLLFAFGVCVVVCERCFPKKETNKK